MGPRAVLCLALSIPFSLVHASGYNPDSLAAPEDPSAGCFIPAKEIKNPNSAIYNAYKDTYTPTKKEDDDMKLTNRNDDSCRVYDPAAKAGKHNEGKDHCTDWCRKKYDEDARSGMGCCPSKNHFNGTHWLYDMKDADGEYFMLGVCWCDNKAATDIVNFVLKDVLAPLWDVFRQVEDTLKDIVGGICHVFMNVAQTTVENGISAIPVAGPFARGGIVLAKAAKTIYRNAGEAADFGNWAQEVCPDSQFGDIMSKVFDPFSFVLDEISVDNVAAAPLLLVGCGKPGKKGKCRTDRDKGNEKFEGDEKGKTPDTATKPTPATQSSSSSSTSASTSSCATGASATGGASCSAGGAGPCKNFYAWDGIKFDGDEDETYSVLEQRTVANISTQTDAATGSHLLFRRSTEMTRTTTICKGKISVGPGGKKTSMLMNVAPYETAGTLQKKVPGALAFGYTKPLCTDFEVGTVPYPTVINPDRTMVWATEHMFEIQIVSRFLTETSNDAKLKLPDLTPGSLPSTTITLCQALTQVWFNLPKDEQPTMDGQKMDPLNHILAVLPSTSNEYKSEFALLDQGINTAKKLLFSKGRIRPPKLMNQDIKTDPEVAFQRIKNVMSVFKYMEHPTVEKSFKAEAERVAARLKKLDEEVMPELEVEFPKRGPTVDTDVQPPAGDPAVQPPAGNPVGQPAGQDNVGNEDSEEQDGDSQSQGQQPAPQKFQKWTAIGLEAKFKAYVKKVTDDSIKKGIDFVDLYLPELIAEYDSKKKANKDLERKKKKTRDDMKKIELQKKIEERAKAAMKDWEAYKPKMWKNPFP